MRRLGEAWRGKTTAGKTHLNRRNKDVDGSIWLLFYTICNAVSSVQPFVRSTVRYNCEFNLEIRTHEILKAKTTLQMHFPLRDPTELDR